MIQYTFILFLLIPSIFCQYGISEEWTGSISCAGASSTLEARILNVCNFDEQTICNPSGELEVNDYTGSNCTNIDPELSFTYSNFNTTCERIPVFLALQSGIGRICNGVLPGAPDNQVVQTTYENDDCTGNIIERAISNPDGCISVLGINAMSYCENGQAFTQFFREGNCNSRDGDPVSVTLGCDNNGEETTCGASGPQIQFLAEANILNQSTFLVCILLALILV